MRPVTAEELPLAEAIKAVLDAHPNPEFSDRRAAVDAIAEHPATAFNFVGKVHRTAAEQAKNSYDPVQQAEDDAYNRLVGSERAKERRAREKAEESGRGALVRTDPRDLLHPDRPKPEYVLEPMVREGTVVGLVAPPASRKSLFLMGASVAVARGDAEFADMPVPRPRLVAYVDMENTEDDYADRWASFGMTHEDEPLDRLHPLILPDLPPLDTAEGGQVLIAYLDDNGFGRGDVVVLDSYQRVTEGARTTATAPGRCTGTPWRRSRRAASRWSTRTTPARTYPRVGAARQARRMPWTPSTWSPGRATATATAATSSSPTRRAASGARRATWSACA